MTDHRGRVSRLAGSHRARAAYAVAQALKDNGIEHMFLVTGGDLWLWRALRDVGISMHLARSEAGAVVMADAYARVTGRPAVVYGQWGPGAANVAGALADAWWARSPVLALTSAVSTKGENRLEYQELHQVPMFEPVTKWQAHVTRADRAAELVSMALYIATAGCPGPVHLDIPTDLFTEEVELAQSYRLRSPALSSAPSRTAVEAIVARLGEAQRPLILSGNGLLIAQGTEELKMLAELTSIPVMTTMGGKGSIREDHPLAMGVVGRYSRRVCNQIAAEADLVIAFGTDLDALATDTYSIPGQDTTVIQIDMHAERMSISRSVDVAVIADAHEAASALIHRLHDTKPLQQHVIWSTSVREKVAQWHADFIAQARRPSSGYVRQEALIQTLSELAHPDDIVVVDTGFMGAWGELSIQCEQLAVPSCVLLAPWDGHFPPYLALN
ncbi:hypothetical protein KSC_105710 [Ktedonobacter sp. SOSP1-52]|uniref:thiamine pyrophosphate-binding protein n=1 Tax=Ktedonobacter sp. SOSP1-52 TaxID=2778366 RepID=UPI0019157BC7|nr:thiamine pyrophosphate-binding protein [Ktedonobacter sp. SOSP1-52]GHO71679.1 hypothetical protein KSC_105710 [Ktedonobacter sp. SOSP1-52]